MLALSVVVEWLIAVDLDESERLIVLPASDSDIQSIDQLLKFMS